MVKTLNEFVRLHVKVAAGIGDQTAAGYQLSTVAPVMPVSGFNGSNPSPTLEQFQQYVAQGQIHWFIAGSSGGPGGMGPRWRSELGHQ